MSNNKEKHDILSHPTSANGMLDYYEPDHRPKTAKELSLDYPVTVLDTRFQRYGGHEYGSGWSEKNAREFLRQFIGGKACLLYTSPSPRDKRQSRMPSSA